MASFRRRHALLGVPLLPHGKMKLKFFAQSLFELLSFKKRSNTGSPRHTDLPLCIDVNA